MDVLCSFLQEIHAFLSMVQHSNCINKFDLNIDIKMGSSSLTLQHLLSGTDIECVILSKWQQQNLHSSALKLKHALQHLISSMHSSEDCYSPLTPKDNYTQSYVMNSNQIAEVKSPDHASVKGYCQQPYMEMPANQLQPTTKETEAANVLMNLSGKASERNHLENQRVMHNQDLEQQPENQGQGLEQQQIFQGQGPNQQQQQHLIPVQDSTQEHQIKNHIPKKVTYEHDRYDHPAPDSSELSEDDSQIDTNIPITKEDYKKTRSIKEIKNKKSRGTRYSNLVSTQNKELKKCTKSPNEEKLISGEMNSKRAKINLQEKEVLVQNRQALDIPMITKNVILPVTTQMFCPICNHPCVDLVEVHEHIMAQHNLSEGTQLSTSHVQLQTIEPMQGLSLLAPQGQLLSSENQITYPTAENSRQNSEVQKELQVAPDPKQGLNLVIQKTSEIEQIPRMVSKIDAGRQNEKSVSLIKQNDSRSSIPFKGTEHSNNIQKTILGKQNKKISMINCDNSSKDRNKNFRAPFQESQNKVSDLISNTAKNLHLLDSQDICVKELSKAGSDQPPLKNIHKQIININSINEKNNISKNTSSINSQSSNLKIQDSKKIIKKNSSEHKLVKSDPSVNEIQNVSINDHKIYKDIQKDKSYIENNYITNENNKNNSLTTYVLQYPEKIIEPAINMLQHAETKVNLELSQSKENPKKVEKSKKVLFRVGGHSKDGQDQAQDPLALAVESTSIRVLDHRTTVSICLGCTTGFVGSGHVLAHSCPGNRPLIATKDNGSVSLTEPQYIYNEDPTRLAKNNVWHFPDFVIQRLERLVDGRDLGCLEMIHNSSRRIFALDSDNIDAGTLCQNMFVFKCPKCCTEHDSLDYFLQHLVVGPCVFRCTECTLMYNTPEKVETHRTSVHPSEEDRTCPRCNQVFEKRHLRNKHLITKCSQQVVCQVCGAVLKNKYNLMVHMKSHSERQYVCTECNKAFHRKAVLVRHMLKHQGHKPFQCSTCNQRFSNKHHLKLHADRHIGNRRYSCSYCDKNFYTQYDCDKHSKRFHLKHLGTNCDTGNSNRQENNFNSETRMVDTNTSRLVTSISSNNAYRMVTMVDNSYLSKSIEKVSNGVIEKDQKKIFQVTKAAVETNNLCKQNESNKMYISKSSEELYKMDNGSEADAKEKYLNDIVVGITNAGNIGTRKNLYEDDDPDDPDEVDTLQC